MRFVKHTLDNGLDVIAHEDRRVPLVAINLWYHVGSKNEVPGRTGLAHLFEHLMFEGSAHSPRSYFGPLQEAGAAINGSTNTDRTNYWETVPSGAVDRALWMEADRMGWLLPILTEARFNTQRDVVLNERRQNYENRPYGLAHFALVDAQYPPDHPYHWPTIGQPDDLRQASLDDARTFFQRYYHPGNASLAIGGDIDPEQAFVLAERYFGAIPRGPAVAPVVVSETRRAGRRLVLEDRVDLARVYFSWPSPPLFAAGDAELDLVGDILANGRTSRLYGRLVHDRRIATELGASQSSRELGGSFQIVATAAPDHTLDELATAITEEVSAFIAGGPTVDELERGRAQAEAAFVFRLQALGGFGGKMDQLNAYNVHRGTPDFFDGDLARYTGATSDDLRETAARWLDPSHAVALCVVPHGQAHVALAGSEPTRPT